MEGEKFNDRISGFTDTGAWKLFIYISSTGVSALMKNDYEERPEQFKLFERQWSEKEPDILKNIESAVYDNPRILDDFSTHIIIDTEKTLLVPSELVEDDEFEPEMFTEIYPTDEGEIFMDHGEQFTVLYTLVPGLKSFLARTLPGSKISSALTVINNFITKTYTNREARCYGLSHGDDLYTLLYAEGELLCASKHTHCSPEDTLYWICLPCEAYGRKKEEIKVRVIGSENYFRFVSESLSSQVKKVKLISPALYENETELRAILALHTNKQL